MSSPESLLTTSNDEFVQGQNVIVERRQFDDRTWSRLDERVVLITGGARGIGGAEAKLFAAEGARVVITDILDERGRALADEIGEHAMYVHLDVSSDEGWNDVVGAAAERFGPIDSLVHNAAIAPHSLIEATETRDFAEVINIDLTGAFRAIRACIAPMTAAGGGSMVVISSMEAQSSHPTFAAYCSAKAGLLGLVRTAALELAARGIRVNALCPGGVDTEIIRPPGVPREALAAIDAQIPLGHMAEPSEIARAAMFLVSDDSRYVTGTSLFVDGGLMAKQPLNLG